MPTEPSPQEAPKPPRVRVTPDELARFGDEDQVRTESNDDRLRAERPPHHW